MRLLFASDSFKGSLSSNRIIELLDESARCVLKNCKIIGVPIADGGEGTVDSVLSIRHGNRRTVIVHDPLFKHVEASYGMIDDNVAIIEMASASGLTLVPETRRNPLYTTTYGTGELIVDALNQGVRKIYIGIGGSATNDGGMGAMAALGAKFLNSEGKELVGVGLDLSQIESIDLTGMHPAISNTEFIVLCDVHNPLTGADGATYTFGTQKGATQETKKRLEKGMVHYAQVIERIFGIDPNKIPGAGAAGGLGAALAVFLNATLKSGVETILDLIEFDRLLDDVDVVITGEGCVDWQSLYGKVVCGVANRCRAKGLPAIAIVGYIGQGAEKIHEEGIKGIIPIIDQPMTVEEAMSSAEDLYRNAAIRTFELLKVGMQIGKNISDK